MNKDLAAKYRPQTLEEVAGLPEATIKAIKKELTEGKRKFLFSGPSGSGKTTLAKLVGKMLGCPDGSQDYMKHDSTYFSGVDSVRELVSTLRNKPLYGKYKIIHIEECHSLSKQAQQAFLLPTEEDMRHIVWIFTTSLISKMDTALRSRFTEFKLRKLSTNELESIARNIYSKETLFEGASKIELKEIMQFLIKRAEGNAREFVNSLQQCSGAKGISEVRDILGKTEPSDDVGFGLAKALVYSSPNKVSVQKALNEVLDDQTVNPESVRILVYNVAGAALRKNTNENQQRWLVTLLQSFEDPCKPETAKADLTKLCMRVLL